MSRILTLTVFTVLLFAACGLADTTQPTTAQSAAESLYDRVTPSLVAVQFTLNYEFGRIEWVGPGVVVSSDGLVLVPGDIVNENFPRRAAAGFQDHRPRHQDKDNEEIPADFQGRDEADNSVAFVKVKTIQRPSRSHLAADQIRRRTAAGRRSPCLLLACSPKAPAIARFSPPRMLPHARSRRDSANPGRSGALGNLGAPVFDENGAAVGMVNGVLYSPYLSQTGARAGHQRDGPGHHAAEIVHRDQADFASGIASPPAARRRSRKFHGSACRRWSA